VCLGAAVIRKTAGVPLDTLQTSRRDALEASTAGSGVAQQSRHLDRAGLMLLWNLGISLNVSATCFWSDREARRGTGSPHATSAGTEIHTSADRPRSGWRVSRRSRPASSSTPSARSISRRFLLRLFCSLIRYVAGGGGGQ
jgi:hypothetical protein